MPEGGEKKAIDVRRSSDSWRQAEAIFSPGPPPIPAMDRPTRALDFPQGYNRQWTPRSYEPFGFSSLRSFSNVELVRLAIETRKDQIERLDWQVRTKINRKGRTDS